MQRSDNHCEICQEEKCGVTWKLRKSEIYRAQSFVDSEDRTRKLSRAGFSDMKSTVNPKHIPFHSSLYGINVRASGGRHLP
jgi:hypothetical protein